MKQAPAKATEAHADYKKLLEVLRLGRMAGAMLGKYLFQLRANNVFRNAVGEGIDTWEDFLKMPEVNLSGREATRAMEIYEQFCIHRGYSVDMLAEAGTKTLHYLLPLVKQDKLSNTEIRGLLKDSASLTQNAFKERLHDIRGGTRHYEFVLMRRCIETNNLQKVHDVTSEQIVDALKSLYHIDLTEKIMPEVI